MTTETHERFLGDQPNRANLNRKSVGGKEVSGFTHAYNVEPVTYHPDYVHLNDVPAWLTARPTGVSIMKTHYRPSQFSQGNDPLPKISNLSDRDTGFTSGTKAKPVFVNHIPSDAYDKAADVPAARLDRTFKQDPAEYINMTHPDNHSRYDSDTQSRYDLDSHSRYDPDSHSRRLKLCEHN